MLLVSYAKRTSADSFVFLNIFQVLHTLKDLFKVFPLNDLS